MESQPWSKMLKHSYILKGQTHHHGKQFRECYQSTSAALNVFTVWAHPGKINRQQSTWMIDTFIVALKIHLVHSRDFSPLGDSVGSKINIMTGMHLMWLLPPCAAFGGLLFGLSQLAIETRYVVKIFNGEIKERGVMNEYSILLF